MWRKIVGAAILIITIFAAFFALWVTQIPDDYMVEEGYTEAQSKIGKTMAPVIVICGWAVLMVPLGILFAALGRTPPRERNIKIEWPDAFEWRGWACPDCGAGYGPNDNYCPKCGAKLPDRAKPPIRVPKHNIEP